MCCCSRLSFVLNGVQICYSMLASVLLVFKVHVLLVLVADAASADVVSVDLPRRTLLREGRRMATTIAKRKMVPVPKMRLVMRRTQRVNSGDAAAGAL